MVIRGTSGAWIRQRRKNFIRIILKQLSELIGLYPKEEQQLLHEFYEILVIYDIDIVNSRDKFIEKANKYLKEYKYSQLPFHWFSCTFLRNAIVYLSISDLYGHPFYQFVEQVLRGTKGMMGALEIIRKKTPLTESGWEEVQYTAVRLTQPLTSSELTVLNILAKITYTPYKKALSQNYLLKKLANTEYSTPKRFNDLASILDLRWRILFHLPAFGLEQMAFKIKMEEKNTTLTSLLDLKSPNNSVMTSSTVYKDRNTPDTYFGIFVIPNYCTSSFREYLKSLEGKGVVQVDYLEQVLQTQFSFSLNHYEANKGWKTFTKSEKADLESRLKTNRPRRAKVPLNFYLTKEFDSQWNYVRESDDITIINQFCKFFELFTYPSLPHLSKTERKVLETLHQNKVCHNYFYSMRLIDEYSLNDYWIKIPNTVSFNKIARILAFLPVTTIFTTERSRYLWTRLKKDDMGLLRVLKIEIDHIMIESSSDNIIVDFFDKSRKRWKNPAILADCN